MPESKSEERREKEVFIYFNLKRTFSLTKIENIIEKKVLLYNYFWHSDIPNINRVIQ